MLELSGSTQNFSMQLFRGADRPTKVMTITLLVPEMFTTHFGPSEFSFLTRNTAELLYVLGSFAQLSFEKYDVESRTPKSLRFVKNGKDARGKLMKNNLILPYSVSLRIWHVMRNRIAKAQLFQPERFSFAAPLFFGARVFFPARGG